MNTDLLNDFIADLKTDLDELRREAAISCITSTPFIVEVGGLPLRFTFEGIKALTCDPCSLPEADRFSRENAQILADAVSNGAGEEGAAVTYYAARAKLIEKLERTVARLEATAA